MKPVSVFVTVSTAGGARRIARALLDARLAACVNITGLLDSHYRWKGRIERSREVGLIAKTTASRLNHLIRTVKAHHPYEVPCIVAWPIIGGNPDFLRWIEQETARPAQSLPRPKKPARKR